MNQKQEGPKNLAEWTLTGVFAVLLVLLLIFGLLSSGRPI